MKNRLYKFIFDDGFLAIILFACAVLPFVLLSPYNFPANDDYQIANNIIKEGFLQTQLNCYNNWSGRYFSTAFSGLNPLTLHLPWLFKFTPLVIMIGLYVSIYTLIKTLNNNLPPVTRHGITSLLLILYFIQMPSIGEGIFWFTGTITYQVPVMLGLLLISCIFYYLKNPKTYIVIISTALVIMIAGANEIAMFYMDIALLPLTVIYILGKNKGKYFFLILFVTALLCSVLVITSPGNAIRGLSYPDKHRFFASISSSVNYGLNYIVKWFINVLVVFFIVFDLITNRSATNPAQATAPKSKNYYLVFGILLYVLVPITGFFPSFWSMGLVPPPRADNMVYCFTILSIFILVYFFATHVKSKFALQSIVKLVCWATLITLSFTKLNNISTAYNDICSGRAANFDLEMKNREAILNNSSADSCHVAPINDAPYSMFFYDINNSRWDWWNRMQCDYYHKKRITCY